MSTSKTLATIRRGDIEEIRLIWTEFETHPYLNISYWQKDGSGGWTVRGEKTTSVRIRELDEYAAGVALAQKEAAALAEDTPAKEPVRE